MAAYSTITLAGGIKAPVRRPSLSTTAAAPLSPAHAAFARLNEALADAADAEDLRSGPAAWDVAYVDPDTSADAALYAVLNAARAAGNAPIVIASDRRLAFAARFITSALSIADGADRTNILHFMSLNQPLLGASSPGLTARRIDALIERALGRLLRLTEAQHGLLPDFSGDQSALFDAPLF